MNDIDKAIKVLRDNYERAQKLEHVRYKKVKGCKKNGRIH